MSLTRRFRGAVLRLVRQRGLALVVGSLLLLPAVWVQTTGRFDQWWVEGLSLVAGATGAALVWTGIAGLKPDWIDDD